MATPTVVNILGLRFANLFLEPVWNNRYIDSVEIIFDEVLTVEGRAGYYDSVGALRDMIQSHLLLVTGLIALDAPATLNRRDVREAIASILRASEIDGDFLRSTRRARYTAGAIGARSVPNYVDEPGVDADRNTETMAEVETSINNWRWAGVPFILRSGKSLARYQKEAIITFKPVPHLPTGFASQPDPARARIGFAPETLRLEFDVNSPGDVFTLDRAVMKTDLANSDTRYPSRNTPPAQTDRQIGHLDDHVDFDLAAVHVGPGGGGILRESGISCRVRACSIMSSSGNDQPPLASRRAQP